MSLTNVLVSMPLKPEYKEAFQQALPGARVTFSRFEHLEEQQLAAFDGLVGNPEKETLEKFTGLRFLQLISSGVAAPYVEFAKQHPGLTLCSASGAYGGAISEHMLGALLMLLKRLHEYRDDMQTGEWKPRGDVRSPRDLTILMVGAGSIGTAFAQLMKPLGAAVIGVRRAPGAPLPGFDELHTFEALDELLPRADVVALAVPETPHTQGLMDERRFGLMKEGSILLNVGRGSAVNQEALLGALQSGRLAGASIDVTTPEPLPPEHPLWKEKNLLITPHISGQFYLKDTHDQVVAIACKNLQAYPDGPFISRVDMETGYRER